MIGQQNPADDHGKIRDEHSGKLLAIANSSTAVGAFAVQGSDDGTADNRRRIVGN